MTTEQVTTAQGVHTTSLLKQSTKSTLDFLFGIRSSYAMNAPLCICYTKKLNSISDRIRFTAFALYLYNKDSKKKNVRKLVKGKDNDFSQRGTIF